MEDEYLDSLIEDLNQKEEEKTEAYFGLLLLRIKSLTLQIHRNTEQAEKECKLINQWTSMKNFQLCERIYHLENQLEGFIRERKQKTIDLPNGILKFHKRPDRIEVSDMELFLKNASHEILTIIPESCTPNLNKIKAYIKTRPIPPGINLIEGEKTFTYKIKGLDDDREEENRNGVEQAGSI